ncbi:ferric reductase-like transmembrane domain-containing protein [Cocleimonas flava]|uniref:Putative ferric reductase n=1 Tax=Cocleimonas flava TaxID=634765 RepID=A0A4R1FD57_9GAMM|nr:ferric reductase-like transmembrane domain-containing protein [Cocleimonas flava]TCJ88761.1 putative ferric reductase [Cocleimonas flava]
MLRNIKLSLWGFLIGLSGLWILANLSLPETLNFKSIRDLFIQYSGVIAMGTMSIAMVLALRPVWLEPWLGGLDKSYRLHKWLGISALTGSVLHWLAKNVPHWAIDLGLMERGARGPRPDPATLSAAQQFFNELRKPAEFVGEWIFYAVVLLIALALIKRFPYRLFAKTHKLLAVAYLALVFHTIVLLDFAAWTKPLGIFMGLLLLAGTVSAVLVLTNQIGKKRQAEGTIETQHHFPEMKVLETSILLKDGWKGHKSGQFAFVNFDAKEGQHPFTIASAWNAKDPHITFITKGLGDYTDLLPEQLHSGNKVNVEGPYGCFTFDDNKKRQIWIGGGIGITPFIARMKQLAQHQGGQAIDLFHSATELAPEALEKLTADAAAANVTLHVMIDSRDGFLTGEKIRNAVPEWQSASFWFCGPAGFGSVLRKDMSANGLPKGAFHQELFNMR